MSEHPFLKLKFDNRFVQELPADPDPSNFRRQVRNACYSRVLPTPVREPRLLAWCREMAAELGLSINADNEQHAANVLGGNQVVSGMDPFAMCYGGHQFGNWAGQLGDGRAINLCEVQAPSGQHWTLQLKGAGPTPFSRTADGLAVLRSSLREYLCSEAMFHLGVPTTRALSLVTTGEMVVRDMFYDGNPRREPGAVSAELPPRLCGSGTFRFSPHDATPELLKKLVDYTIRRDFQGPAAPDASDYAAWFSEVCRLTAVMIVHWMRVGFVHGVMNTDNMSILGLTIDYGPYGWLEDYDPAWTPNTTDASGRRYRFGNQPQIAMWNLAQLANALSLLFPESEPLQKGLDLYASTFNDGWRTMMLSKLGLRNWQEESDQELIDELLSLLQLTETDMTIFFRRLALVVPGLTVDESTRAVFDAYYVPEERTAEYKQRFASWIREYQARTLTEGLSQDARLALMNSVNPKYVLRNYLAQLAIDRAEQGDASLLHQLHELLRRPYDEQPESEEFAAKRPDWARSRAGCSMLSCSS